MSRARRPRRRGDESHRGGFGEYGSDGRGQLIERTFRERIVLVGAVLPGRDDESADASLDELSLLVDTAGADEVARVVQARTAPDPATYVGSGKVAEIRQIADELDADTVVFDDELSPAQQYNLERLLGRTALDRTAVILDIFAQNAYSPEGKVQVELAQLRYLLPRLRGHGRRLSQQAGGIGTRGPGETQLEVDRRKLERRIHKLESDLRSIGVHRRTQRKSRRRSPFRAVSIVGYTNAGKSTLLNQLTEAGVLVEDRLFATLDTTTRRLQLPGGERILLSDTVGFVTKLPHQLVQAFRTTLETVAEADLLAHVVDSAAADPLEQIHAVRSVLAEIGAGDVAELLVFNKADLTDEAARLCALHPGSVAISAKTGAGIDDLIDVIGGRLRALGRVVELLIPYGRGDVLASVHREGEVLDSVPVTEGLRVTARLEPAACSRLAEFVQDPSPPRRV